jgi:hypothetical protein
MMKIGPNAIIAHEKLADYLLKLRPKDDKSKFLARSGFTEHNVKALETEIRRLTEQTEAEFDRVREHGEFYDVLGEIVGPTGVPLAVKLVWLRRVDGVFSFVTLVPQTK